MTFSLDWTDLDKLPQRDPFYKNRSLSRFLWLYNAEGEELRMAVLAQPSIYQTHHQPVCDRVYNK